MRKLIHIERKDDNKRSNTIGKSQLGNYPEQTLKYFVGCGNNGQLIRRVLSTRSKWRQGDDSKELFLNMRWQQSNKGYKYQNCIDNRIFKHSLNHFEHHYQLSNKEYLFTNLYDYCEAHKINAFDFIPLTFVLNLVDSNFQNAQAFFLNFFHQHKHQNIPNDIQTLSLRRRRVNPNHIMAYDKKMHSHFCKYEIHSPYLIDNTPYLWILKPTFYNRGNGVHVFGTLTQLQTLMNKYILGYSPQSTSTIKQSSDVVLKKSFRIKESANNFIIRSSSFVVQKYMESPLLFRNRKFDIRMWVLFSHEMKVYLFKQGYLRTSSYQYNLNQDKVSDLNIHLTNNAVQKFTDDYGKYQLGNQLSFQYLKEMIKEAGKNYEELMGKIKQIIKITGLSVRKKINKQDRSYCFEIFGYDFMLDSDCKPWLIEVNTNPCIEESSPILQQLLPRMLDDAFSLTIDQIFQIKKHHCHFPVEGSSNNQNMFQFIVDLKKN